MLHLASTIVCNVLQKMVNINCPITSQLKCHKNSYCYGSAVFNNFFSGLTSFLLFGRDYGFIYVFFASSPRTIQHMSIFIWCIIGFAVI